MMCLICVVYSVHMSVHSNDLYQYVLFFTIVLHILIHPFQDNQYINEVTFIIFI